MTFFQIYNLVWLVVWLIGLVFTLYGAIVVGNPLHWVLVAASLYFSTLLFLDKEDGESLKELLTRAINKRKAK